MYGELKFRFFIYQAGYVFDYVFRSCSMKGAVTFYNVVHNVSVKVQAFSGERKIGRFYDYITAVEEGYIVSILWNRLFFQKDRKFENFQYF